MSRIPVRETCPAPSNRAELSFGWFARHGVGCTAFAALILFFAVFSRHEVSLNGVVVSALPQARAAQSAGSLPRPSEAALRSVVAELASPAYEGRRGAGGVKAGDYLIKQFRRLKLEPLFDGDFVQPVPGKEPGWRG